MATRRHGRIAAGHVDDSDLHVDVMRFFAIVALCLFAILPHTESSAPKQETQYAKKVSAPSPIQHTLPKFTEIPQLPITYSLPPVSDKPRQEVTQGSSSTAESGGVRFMDANTFTTAVKNGSIRLVYHREVESFVFDAASSNFIAAGDEPLQLFALAASEVPALFQQLAPSDDRIQRVKAKWFITLPEHTLAHLFEAASDRGTTIILDDSAMPI